VSEPVVDLSESRRARVLVVDDDHRSATTLQQVLDAAGFHSAVVRTRRVVTDVVRDEQVAVVLVSNSSRGIAATTDLVALLRTRPEPPLRDVGIVALVDDEIDAAFGLGDEADAVLVRPVDAGRLVDVVTEVAATPAAARVARRRAGDGAFFRYRMGLATS
jgi:DNA-binding response OmpR family regulator